MNVCSYIIFIRLWTMMEMIYAVDMKMSNDGEEFERTFAMDISSMNVLACSCYYLFASSKLKYSPHLVSTALQQTAKSSFCIYVCALEQPWHFCLIATSHVPIVHLVWSLDGMHLLVCNQIGLCRIFKMKNGCINTMENVYQYETNEDIITAKYLFCKEPIIINLEQKDSLFYERDAQSSPFLHYALQSGNFVCVTTSGTIHTLPLNRSLPPNRYSLPKNDPLSVSLGDIVATDKGFHVILGEHLAGALIHFFVVHYAPLEPKLGYISCRRRGFRIPSCYGKLKSLVYFQRTGNDCVLTHLNLPTGDLIDLYEYNLEQEEWISITLLNSPQFHITSISLSPCVLLVKDNEFQGQLGRQISISSTDGSILVYDKLTLKCKEQSYPLSNPQMFASHRTEYFVRIQHTSSGACAVGITQTGVLVLLRTMTLEHASSPSMLHVLLHLLEQWIMQDPCPMDLWDILSLISNKNYESVFLNELIELFVQRFDQQSIEMKRNRFLRFKQVTFHLHRLACPFSMDSVEHLISLFTYEVLVIIRDYLRLFIYEPTNRNFVETAQEILQQSLTFQSIDFKRIKYLPDQPSEPLPTDPRHYQSISFISLINWISDLIFYFIGYLQLQQLPQWLTCKHIFHDYRQLQWLRELLIYLNVLQKMNKIPSSKMAFLQYPTSVNNQSGQESSPVQKDVLKDIYQSITRLSQKIETQKTGHFDESYLEDFSVLDVELLQSKADGMFPKAYPFLIPNNPLPQTFIRGQAPSFAAHLCGNPLTVDHLGGASTSFSSYSSTLFNDEHFQEMKFDVITLNKLSLGSTTVFRRCLRCSNFSRVYKNKPYPLFTYRFNHRCICGGLFLLYTRSTTLSSNNAMMNNPNNNSNETTTSATNR